MTENELREKVINGLECCAAMSGDECKECPYSKECLDKDLPYGMPHLAANALALLKAQEPRVMTLEEVRALSKKDCGVAVCVEQRYPIYRWDGGSYIKWVGSTFVHEEYLTSNKFYNPGTYNQTWRIWSEKPTDKQRETATWDELTNAPMKASPREAGKP